jgi:hypothetical protein
MVDGTSHLEGQGGATVADWPKYQLNNSIWTRINQSEQKYKVVFRLLLQRLFEADICLIKLILLTNKFLCD